MASRRVLVIGGRSSDGSETLLAEEQYTGESRIEAYFCDEVDAVGGEAEKFVSPGKVGVPDRIVTWKLGDLDYVELKATGERPEPHQVRDHKRRRERGFRVFVVNCYAAADWYIEKGRFLSFTEYMERVEEGHPWCV